MDIRDRLLVATMASDAAEMAATYGVGLELDQFSWANNMDGNMEAFDREIRRMKEITDRMILHAPYSEVLPAAIDERVRKVSMERLNEAYALCRKYGINRMVVHSGFIPEVYFPGWYLNEAVTFWKKFMEDKPETFRIMIENQMETDKDFLPRVCRQIDDPRVGLCLDIGHMLYKGNGLAGEWIKAFSPYCTHVHLHHNDRTWDYHYPLDVPGTEDMNEVLQCILTEMRGVTITLEHITSESSFLWLKKYGYLSAENREKGKKYQGFNSIANIKE